MRSEEDAGVSRGATLGDKMFEELVQLHRPALTRFAARQLGEHSELAEDVVQEALLGAHRAIAAGTCPEHPRAWLFTIVRNTAIDAVRAARPTGEIQERRHASADETVSAAVEQGEWIDWLMCAVGELPSRQRDALVGHAFEGRSYREIAARQQTTVPAVKSLIGRARRALSSGSPFSTASIGTPLAACARGLRALLGSGPLAGKAGAKGLAGVLAQAAVAATVTTGVLMAVHGGTLGSVLASPGAVNQAPGGRPMPLAQAARSRHRPESNHAREQRVHREGHRAINDCFHGRTLKGRYGAAALDFAVKHLSADAREYTECEQQLRLAELQRAGTQRRRHGKPRLRHRTSRDGDDRRPGDSSSGP
jgi:RNA polymerase sigma factor (sigma-70 family)